MPCRWAPLPIVATMALEIIGPMPGMLTSRSQRRGQDAWQLSAQEPKALPHSTLAFQEEGADLIDDARTLAHEPLAHTVQGLQIRRLCDHELHRRTLHRLSNRLRATSAELRDQTL
jgi:hypothetical protein